MICTQAKQKLIIPFLILLAGFKGFSQDRSSIESEVQMNNSHLGPLVGDEKADNSPYSNELFSQFTADGVDGLQLQDGTYLVSRTVELPTGTSLHIESGAVIRATHADTVVFLHRYKL